MENWKTTAAGAAAILGALTDMVTALSHGVITSDLTMDITAIITGIGLIAAKDAKSSSSS